MLSDPVSLNKIADALFMAAARGSVNADNENYSCPVTIKLAREAAEALRDVASALTPVSSTGAEQEECPQCEGDGFGPMSSTCPKCGGGGKVSMSLSVKDDALAISALLDDSQREREMYHQLVTDIRHAIGDDARDTPLLDLPKLIAALRDSSPRTGSEGWQPIETAPQMRKLMVSYINALGKRRCVLACYYKANSLEMDDDYAEVCDFDDATGRSFAPAGWYEEHDSDSPLMPLSEQPTHWMPLPSPPAGSASEKGRE